MIIEFKNGSYQGRLNIIEQLYYNGLDSIQISEKLNVSQSTVHIYLSSLGLTKNSYKPNEWSYRELDIIKTKYESYTIYELSVLLPNRSLSSIRRKAFELGIKKKFVYPQNKPQSDLSILLTDNLISFYWVGCLAADGWISNNTLGLTPGEKDIEHLKKYNSYIKNKGKIKSNYTKSTKLVSKSCLCHGSIVCDKKLVSEIISKFDFKHKKSYNPPNSEVYKCFNNDQLVSFFIGFIDGDGTITIGKRPNGRKVNPRISIENYYNWEFFLNFLINKINEKFNCNNKLCTIRTRINKSNMAVCRINKIEIIKSLKRFAIDNNLPILERKWNKVVL